MFKNSKLLVLYCEKGSLKNRTDMYEKTMYVVYFLKAYMLK